MRDIKRSAELSECGTYRWWLQRRWEHGGKIVCFVMLNPSTADAEQDDPTIRRCIDFAKRWGFAALDVRNLFAYRATDPKKLKAAALLGVDIRGGDRGDVELSVAHGADLIVAAWGKYPCTARAQRFLELTKPTPVYCLKTNADGSPVHPLYQPADSVLKPYARYADEVGAQKARDA